MKLQTMRRINRALIFTTLACYFSGCAQLPDNSPVLGQNTNIPKMLVESIKSK